MRRSRLIWALGMWSALTLAQTASGVVVIKGAATQLAPLKVTKDERVCGRELADESILVGKDGRLANALVVAMVDAPPPEKPSRIAIDQRGCQFSPRVSAIPVGSIIDLTNSDSLLHNARAMIGTALAFNFAFPLKNLKREFTAIKVGLLDLHCDAGHTWMRSFVHVLPHRYFALTDANGHFEIADLPASATALEVRHERLSTPLVVPLKGPRTELRIELPLDAAPPKP